jgi:excisionase family DNA binding protein
LELALSHRSHGKRIRDPLGEGLAALDEWKLDRLEAMVDLERQRRDTPRATGQLLRPDEVAEQLHVSRAHVYNLIERGALRGVRVGDGPKGHLRVEPEAMDEYIRRHTVGHDLAARADRIKALRPELTYAEALAEAGDYDDAMLVDRSAAQISADVDAAVRAGYRAEAASSNSDAVDVEEIVKEEIAKAGDPLSPAVAQAGPTGIDQRARRILRDRGIAAFDATSYREAVRQAIADLKNPKRSV